MEVASVEPIVKTEGICLRVMPWSTTSHIVVWHTPEAGVINLVVKGACRPKSLHLGQYDRFYSCELLYYRRDRSGLHAIRECAPQKPREGLRANWRAVQTASYLAELVERTAGGPTGAARVQRALTRALDELAENAEADRSLVMMWFEVQLLAALGLAPRLEICPACASEQVVWLDFSLTSGRFICPHRLGERGQVVKLQPRIVRAYCALAALPTPHLPEAEGEFAENQTILKSRLGLSRFLGIFIQFHLELPLAVRRVAEASEKGS